MPPDSRLTQAKSTTRFSPKPGRARRRTSRPRLGLTDRLANLHLLLRATSFERWPLKVTFYAEDVHRVWSKWTSQQIEKLRPGIEVVVDQSVSNASNTAVEPSEPRGIDALDVGYSSLKDHLTKSQRAIENAEWLHCHICHQGLPSNGAMTLICPAESCTAMTHIECLSTRFLQAGKDKDAVVPTAGECPGCGGKLQWVDLVKELSLRMRGEKEVAALFKKKRRTKKQVEAAALAADEASAASAEDEEMDDPLPKDEDDWHELPESSDVEDVEAAAPTFCSDPSPPVKRPSWKRKEPTTPRSEPIIEDSDWDEAAVLT